MTAHEEILRQLERVRHDKSEMRIYQSEEIVPFLTGTPYSAAYVDMGLGKTVSVLTVLDDLFMAGAIRHVLIVAPLRVAIQTWPTEIAEWSHTWWMTYTLIRADERHPELLAAAKQARYENAIFGQREAQSAAGKAKTAHIEIQKRRLAVENTMVHIINREAVEWLVAFWGKKWPYDCVIVDESTSFADKNTKRWKALNSVRPKMTRLHLLSGVPAPEGIEDYFAQIYLLDRGERFGRAITKFRERYMIEDRYKHKWKSRPGADTEVASLIAPICLVMREEDYLERKKDLIVERPIILSYEEMRLYKDFEKHAILALDDDIEIEAESGASLAGKLVQMASGAVYDETHQWHVVHDHKLTELKQLREEAQGSPLLVAYWHRSSLERIMKAFPKAVKMDRRGECVKAWNAGKIDMLLIHPRSAGHGLNMQLGPGHTLIWFDNPQPLEDYLQTGKRLSRPGQKKRVKQFHLVTRGTIDAAIVPALRSKNDAQDAVKKYIRDLRKQWREDDAD